MHQTPANPYASPPPANPYAAPVARVDDAPVEGIVLADRATRLGAAILDFMTFGALGFVGGLVAAIAVPQSGSDDPETVMWIVFGLVGVASLVVLAVNLVLLHRNGQTIGKKIVNIRIARPDGSHCPVLRVIFARWLPMVVVGMIPFLGLLVQLIDVLFIFRDDQRCIHDHIADTIVVRA
ncbi:MAG TPA: RDD family protein [Xanthomonadales bacterium]|nr:RDD family protein [Xanthomonadales bacterium]